MEKKVEKRMEKREMDLIKKELLQHDIIGNGANTNELYIELNNVYSTDEVPFKILNLFHIFVPIHQRNMGIATKIIKICEEIAQERGLAGLWVGPFVTDESEFLIKICKKNGYTACMPFGMIKTFDDSLLISSVIDESVYKRMMEKNLQKDI